MRSDPLSHCRSRLTPPQLQAAEALLAEYKAIPMIAYDAKSQTLTIRAIKDGVDRVEEIGPRGAAALVQTQETDNSLALVLSPHTSVAERAAALVRVEKHVAKNYLDTEDELEIARGAKDINAGVIAATQEAEMLLEAELLKLIPWATDYPALAREAYDLVDPDAVAGKPWQVNQWVLSAMPKILEAGLTEAEVATANRGTPQLVLSTAQREVEKIADDSDLSLEEKRAAYRELLTEMKKTVPTVDGRPQITASQFAEDHRTRRNIPPVPMAIHRQPDGGAVVWALCDEVQLASLKSRLRNFYLEVSGPELPTWQFILRHSRAEAFRNAFLGDPLRWRIVKCLEQGEQTRCDLVEMFGPAALAELNLMVEYYILGEKRVVDKETGEATLWYHLKPEDAVEEVFK